MLFELIAVIVAGLAAAGVAMLLRRLVPAVPRWLLPVAGGAAMLAATITLEYSWYGRTAEALPDGLAVAVRRQSSVPWRPWTYAVPYTEGFLAVDRAGARINAAQPDLHMVDVLAFGRWQPVQRVTAIFDCAAGRRADILPGVEIGEDGALAGATWHETGLDDPLTRAACGDTS